MYRNFNQATLTHFCLFSGEDNELPIVAENDFVLAAVVDAVYQFQTENRLGWCSAGEKRRRSPAMRFSFATKDQKKQTLELFSKPPAVAAEQTNQAVPSHRRPAEQIGAIPPTDTQKSLKVRLQVTESIRGLDMPLLRNRQ